MPPARTIDICWLPNNLRDNLTQFASAWHPNEVGGILAGYISGNAIVVTEIVGPGPDAVHKRYSFMPDHAFHLTEMQRLYNASGGVNKYLGDWHSHPEGPASLSPLDKNTLRTIALSPDALCPQPLMILASGGKSVWAINAFILEQDRYIGTTRIVSVRINFY